MKGWRREKRIDGRKESEWREGARVVVWRRVGRSLIQ